MATAQRSPAFFNRRGNVRTVKSRGSRLGVSSVHLSGVETEASGRARTLYAEATVLPGAFWPKST